MTLKLLIFFTACVLLVHASGDVEREEDTESYITREAAKELRNKLGIGKHHESDATVEQQPDDYDEILREIIRHLPKQQQQQPQNQQQQQQQPVIIYEKKYFDYLPNELSDSDDVTSEESSHELVKMAGEYISAEDEQQHKQHMLNNDAEVREGSRKFKRNVSMQQAAAVGGDERKESRSKRQMAQKRQQQILSNSNPWTPQNNPNLKFHEPYNFYLPPATPAPPVNTYLPVSPNNQQSVNMPYPPDNQPTDQIDDRLSLFAEEEKHVWDKTPVNKRPSGGGNNNLRPSDNNFKQQSYNPNSIHLANDKTSDIDIEYAPALEEDITTTTRASLKIPDRKNRNQQKNRQKKSDFETTTTTTPMLRTTESINNIYSQQNYGNSRKPNKPLPACVEAIVNCCSKYDEIVRLPCFEAHNCNGAFFGRSPCSRDIKQSAFKEVEKYARK